MSESRPESTEPVADQSAISAKRKQSIIRYLKLAFFTKIPSSLMPLVVVPMASHVFGREYDAFTALVTILGIFNILNFGLGPAAGVEFSPFAEKPNAEKESRLFASTFVSYLGSSLVMSLIVLLLVFGVGAERIFGPNLSDQVPLLNRGMLILAVAMIVLGLGAVVSNAYWGFMQDYKNSQANIVAQILMVGLTFAAVAVFRSPLMFVAAYAMTGSLISCLHGIRLFKFDRKELRFDLRLANLNVAWRLFTANSLQSISSVGYLLSRMAPILLLSWTAPSATAIGRAGTFNVWHQPVTGLLSVFAASAIPAISAAISSQDTNWAKRAVKKFAKFLTLGFVLIFIGSITLGPTVSRLLFSERYSMNMVEFTLLALCAASTTVLGFANSVCLTLKRYRDNAIAGVVQGVLGFSLAAVMMPKFGLAGYAAPMAIAEFTAAGILILVIRREFKLISQTVPVAAEPSGSTESPHS